MSVHFFFPRAIFFSELFSSPTGSFILTKRITSDGMWIPDRVRMAAAMSQSQRTASHGRYMLSQALRGARCQTLRWGERRQHTGQASLCCLAARDVGLTRRDPGRCQTLRWGEIRQHTGQVSLCCLAVRDVGLTRRVPGRNRMKRKTCQTSVSMLLLLLLLPLLLI